MEDLKKAGLADGAFEKLDLIKECNEGLLALAWQNYHRRLSLGETYDDALRLLKQEIDDARDDQNVYPNLPLVDPDVRQCVEELMVFFSGDLHPKDSYLKPLLGDKSVKKRDLHEEKDPVEELKELKEDFCANYRRIHREYRDFLSTKDGKVFLIELNNFEGLLHCPVEQFSMILELRIKAFTQGLQKLSVLEAEIISAMEAQEKEKGKNVGQ